MSRNDVTHTNFNCEAIVVREKVNSKKSIPRSQVVRIIDGDDELKKNIAGQVLTNSSKNFH